MVAFSKTRIRIIAVPPGEAPLEIREQWVGLILPLADGMPGTWQLQTTGVITGELSDEETIGYAVEFSEAMAALAETAPDAVKWWKTNTLYLFEEEGVLIFEQDVCEPLSS